MLQQHAIFVFVMTDTKRYRQLGAVFLLLLLLCTTAVQLTHSHALKQPAATAFNQPTSVAQHDIVTTDSADAKCFVHEYQLAKDADFYCVSLPAPPASLHLINGPSYHSPLTAAYCSYFENRGPPAAFAQA
jgi:hypothetical protein